MKSSPVLLAIVRELLGQDTSLARIRMKHPSPLGGVIASPRRAWGAHHQNGIFLEGLIFLVVLTAILAVR